MPAIKPKDIKTLPIPPHIGSVLMLGVAAQVAQVLLLRELLMVFHGNELSIGLILAAWMLWVGAGSRLGAFLAEKTNRPFSFILKSSMGIMVLLPATIFLIRIWRGFFELPPGAHFSLPEMAASCFLLLLPVGLLLGAQFVFLSRMWREYDKSLDSSGTGKTYIGEAAGNMAGGLLFTFLLVHFLNSFESALLMGMLMVATAIYAQWKKATFSSINTGEIRLYPPVGLGLLILGLLIFPLLGSVDERAYDLQWEHYTPEHELVETQQSEHGAISVVQRRDQFTFFQSGHLVFSTAGAQTLAPGLEEQDAVEFAHMAMSQHQDPKQVLLIGGGLRGLLGEITRYPVENIDYVELDETLTETARKYVSPSTRQALEDPRVNLIHTDGRLFIKSAHRQQDLNYDLIIVDIPDPATAALNRFYTVEFFKEAKKLLKPEGVMVGEATSTPDLRGTAVANRNSTIYHTLNSVFERVLPAGERTMLFFASDEPDQITLNPGRMQKRFQKHDPDTPDFSPQHFQALLEEGQLRRVNWIARTHGRAPYAHLVGPQIETIFPPSITEQEAKEQALPPVEENYFINTDFSPIGYYYTLMLWDELTRPQHDQTLQFMLQVQWWWLLPPLIIPLLLVLFLRWREQRNWSNSKGPVAKGIDNNHLPENSNLDPERTDRVFFRSINTGILFTVFTTGFSTMALQIAVLFAFQNIYGFVYEMVGLIMALFMFGLAAGAFLSNRYIKDKANLKLLAGMQLIIALLAGIIAIALPWSAGLPSPTTIFVLFATITCASGLINGIDFPISAACHQSLHGKAETTAGVVYGLELAGACLGAVVASAIVAPVLGILACCFMAAIVNFSAFVVLLICTIKRKVKPWPAGTFPNLN